MYKRQLFDRSASCIDGERGTEQSETLHLPNVIDVFRSIGFVQIRLKFFQLFETRFQMFFLSIQIVVECLEEIRGIRSQPVLFDFGTQTLHFLLNVADVPLELFGRSTHLLALIDRLLNLCRCAFELFDQFRSILIEGTIVCKSAVQLLHVVQFRSNLLEEIFQTIRRLIVLNGNRLMGHVLQVFDGLSKPIVRSGNGLILFLLSDEKRP